MRRISSCPAAQHIAEHEQDKDQKIAALVLGVGALFSGQKQDGDAGDAERDHLQKRKIHAAQHGKAVEHGCRCRAQQEEIPGLMGEFELHRGSPPAKIWNCFQIDVPDSCACGPCGSHLCSLA